MSGRPSKRRKVDDSAQKSSPARSATTSNAPITYGSKSQSSPAVHSTIQSNADAKAEWAAAKAIAAKRAATRQKKSRELSPKEELSIYDDFEGAHQARRPAALSRRRTPKPPLNGSVERSADGDHPESHTKTRASRIVSKGNNRVTETGAPKKTSEDEIREIEEKARQQTRNDDSADELAEQSCSKRGSARRASQRATAAKTVVAGTHTRPQDRRTGTSPRDESLEIPESDEEDHMDIDRPDESLVQDDMDFDQLATQKEVTSKAATAKRPIVPTKVPIQPARNAEAKIIRPTGSKTRRDADVTPIRKAIATASTSFDDDHLECIQNVVLEKVTGKRPILLTNLDDEHAKVATVIAQTIAAGESNSMLIIGARGSGKTAMVNQILREQSETHADDFHVVRLSGFIHTDDKIALREIWRQLGTEMELEEDEATSKNYADTMTRLLALLSHPTEHGIETERVTKSVIFVLDEFELFAGHPRQTLLYNLFDIAQSRKAPIAVLGLTTRIDVVESLEKRVKSRFSHRYVHLSLSKNLNAFEQRCRSAVALLPEEFTKNELEILAKGTELTAPALTNWSSVTDQLLASDTCKKFLQRLYYTTKSMPDFLVALTLALATLPTASQTITSVFEHISANMTSMSILQAPDSKLTLLHALSTLQLALLICAARLTNIYDTELVTFALVYEEYKVIASKAKLHASASGGIASSRVWGKNVARDAWEELINVGLVVEDGRSAGAKTSRVDVGLEELGGSGVDLGGWGKWCREI